jgi:hypothetical protein
MRTLLPRVLPLIAIPVIGVLGMSAPVFGGSIDLSWDTCASGSFQKDTTTPGVYSLVLTGNQLNGHVSGTHFVFELRSPGGLPAAWRFDAAGCNASRIQFQTGSTSKACPSIGGFPWTFVDYQMDPGGSAATLTIDVIYSSTIVLSPASTYSLGRVEIDLSDAVVTGDGPGCEGLERPVCITLVEATTMVAGSSTNEDLVPGQAYVTWNDAGGETACSARTLRGARIQELLTACADSTDDAQFLELVQTRAGATLPAELKVRTEAADGSVLFDDAIVSPAQAGANWAVGQSWLAATPLFQSGANLSADRAVPLAFLDADEGRIVLYDGRPGGPVLQEFAYGGAHPLPAPPPGSSLASDAQENYAITAPEARNFAAQTSPGLDCPLPPPPPSPCPQVTFRWGQQAPRTTDTASFDSTSGSHRLAYDRVHPSISVHLDFLTGFVTLRDRFVVTGGAAGQDVEILGLFNVQGSSGGGCSPIHGCAGGIGFVTWTLEDSSGTVGSWPNVSNSFAIPFRVRTGEPFAFSWTLGTETFSNGSSFGVSNFNARMEWANLPPSLHVESCAGYFDDTPVATLPSIVSATSDEGVVRLEWSPLADDDAGGFAVERRTEDSDWSSIGVPVVDRSSIAFEDRSIAPGTRYAYRLRWTDALGTHATEETWFSIPAPSFTARLVTGPVVRGTFEFALTLPTGEVVQIELFDVHGRRIDVQRWQPPGAARNTLEYQPAQPLAPGVYWIRLRQQADQTTLRAIVLTDR